MTNFQRRPRKQTISRQPGVFWNDVNICEVVETETLNVLTGRIMFMFVYFCLHRSKVKGSSIFWQTISADNYCFFSVNAHFSYKLSLNISWQLLYFLTLRTFEYNKKFPTWKPSHLVYDMQLNTILHFIDTKIDDIVISFEKFPEKVIILNTKHLLMNRVWYKHGSFSEISQKYKPNKV